METDSMISGGLGQVLADRDEKSKIIDALEPANGPRGSSALHSAAERPLSGAGRFRSNSETDKREVAAKGLLAPEVRSHFSDTAFWTPAVVTDSMGRASVDVVWPDNLTQWRATALGTTTTAQVGSGTATLRTKKDLIVRLQAPRFFVERDTLLLTANVQNYLPHAARARVRLELGDNTAEITSAAGLKSVAGKTATVAADGPEVWVDVPQGGESRIDWNIHVVREGSLRVKMSAQARDAADAAEMTFPVLVHGVERATAQNGVLREQSEAKITIALPKERKPGSSELVVNLNPSLATIMLDALPYLNGYPYGCVEQTMSRFLPSVIVAQTLKESGYDLEALGKRAKLLQETGARRRPAGKDREQQLYLPERASRRVTDGPPGQDGIQSRIRHAAA